MSPRATFLNSVLSIFMAVMLLLLCAMVLNLRGEIQTLRGETVTHKDLVQARIPELRVFAEEKCTSCHTERRFLNEHMSQSELELHVEQMAAMPDVRLSDQEVAKVHASLNIMKCMQCHDSTVLKELALKSQDERLGVINRMIEKQGSRISSEEMDSIDRSFEMILGF